MDGYDCSVIRVFPCRCAAQGLPLVLSRCRPSARCSRDVPNIHGVAVKRLLSSCVSLSAEACARSAVFFAKSTHFSFSRASAHAPRLAPSLVYACPSYLRVRRPSCGVAGASRCHHSALSGCLWLQATRVGFRPPCKAKLVEIRPNLGEVDQIRPEFNKIRRDFGRSWLVQLYQIVGQFGPISIEFGPILARTRPTWTMFGGIWVQFGKIQIWTQVDQM